MVKTEYLTIREKVKQIQLNGEALRNVYNFKYLGSVRDKGGTIN